MRVLHSSQQRVRSSGPVKAMVLGAAAGAIGTYALDVTTYIDVAVRGRPSSSVPADTAERVVRAFGLQFASGDEETAKNRRSGLGALMGYAAGVSVGIVYATLQTEIRRVPLVVRGVALGALVMGLTDGVSVLAGTTDPRTWGVNGWISDIVPHGVYGVVVAAATDFLR